MVQAYHKEFQLLLLPDKWECNLDAMYCQRWYPGGYLPFLKKGPQEGYR